MKNFQVRLPEDLNKQVDELAAELEASKADVMRKAIRLLYKVTASLKTGGKFTVTHGDGTNESVWFL